MSTTIEKSKKQEELQREIEALQQKVKQEQEAKLLNQQNNWFFDLIGASGEKAINKAEESLHSAQTAFKEANEQLQRAKQALTLHYDNAPSESNKKATKAWKKQLDTLVKQKGSAEKQVTAQELAVTQAMSGLEKATRTGEKEGLKSELSSNQETQKKVVSHAKYEPLYEHRMERLDDLIKKLEDYLPATGSLISTFSNKRTAALNALKADPKPFKTAYDLLPEGKEINAALGQMDTIWSQALEKNVREIPAFKLLSDQISTLRTKLGETGVVSEMSDDELANFHAKLDELETPLHKPRSPKEDVTALAMTQGLALDKLKKEFNLAWEAAHDRKVVVDEKLRAAQEAVSGLARLGSAGATAYADNDRAVFERQLAVIKTTYGAREFGDAGDLLDQLLPSLEKTKATVTEAFSSDKKSWASRQKMLPGMVKSLSEAAQQLQAAINAGAPKEIVQRIQNLNERLKGLQDLKPGINPTYADAIASSKAAEAELLALKKALAGAGTFKADLAKAQQQVAQAAADANTAIADLEKTLLAQFKGGTPPDLAPVLKPLKDEALELNSAWADQVKAATSMAELDVGTACADYLQLAKKAAETGATGLIAAKETISLTPARTKYTEAKQSAQRVARDLMASDPVGAVELLNMIDAADRVAGASTDAQEIQTQADALLKTARERSEAAYRAIQIAVGYSSALDNQLKEVRKQLAELLGNINKISSGEVQTPYAALHGTLESQCEELGVLVGTKLSKLLEAALDDVETLKSEIASAQQAIANEKGLFSKGNPSFGAIRGELAALTERLGKDTVKLYAISTAADLGDKITTLGKGLGSQSLSEAEKELAALKKAVTKAEEDAEAAKVEVDKFEKRVDKDKTMLDAEPFTSSAANLAKLYKGRFEALKSDAVFEGGLDGAETKLVELKAEIKGVLDSPKNDLGIPILVFAGEEDALESKRKGEQDKGRFEGEVDVLKRALASAKKKGVASREIDGLEESLESAEKATKKGNSWADGREQLDGIRKRLALLETNPQGLIISSRNRLGSCNKFLKNEIKRFAQQTKDLAGAVAKADLDDGGKKAVASALGAVRGLFNPAALDPFLPVVASKDPKMARAKRAAAREAALREVRRMMGYIEHDFRLFALSDNPFDPKMAAIISGLKLALLDIENNLLVSLPA